MKLHWMPLDIDDYMRATHRLGALQSGAYLHLIMEYWTMEGLPQDDLSLARIAKMSDKEWKANRATLAAFFQEGWRHDRIDRELAKQKEVIKKRKLAGQRGGMQTAINQAANAAPHAAPKSRYMPQHPAHHIKTERKILPETKLVGPKLNSPLALSREFSESLGVQQGQSK